MSDIVFGILGSEGFVGRNMQDYLTAQGHKFVRGGRSCQGKERVDATNPASVVKWIQDNNVSHLINLAAECGGIGLNKTHPFDLWKSATAISNGVLEAVSLTAVEKLVMIGTVCSYAAECPTPFKEEYLFHHGMPEKTNAAYGVAKLNGYLGTLALRRQFNQEAIFLVPVNMYGLHDHFDLENSHVIPALINKFVTAARDNQPTVTCWGTGKATREFVFARDAAAGIVAAALNYSGEEPVNLGSGDEISIKRLAEIIKDKSGFQGEIIWDSTKPDGQMARRLDCSKAIEHFGWQASTKFEDGLEQTIEWFTKNLCHAQCAAL